jgi:hypothetical protein
VNLNTQECPNAFLLAPGVDLLTLTSFAGFTTQSSPTVIAHITSGVTARSFSFTPSASVTVQLSTPINKTGKLAEAKVFVLSDGGPLLVSYELQPLAQNVQDVSFYSGSIPQTPTLQDNFSANLRIGKVRILKGKPDADPVTNKFRLKDPSVVRPSRIVLIPSYTGDSVFSHDSTRCYSNPNIPDGDIDLTNCRINAGSAGTLQDATPAYLKFTPRSPLTWVAEFRASEGGTPPILDPGEVLAIEFTIQ